MSKKKKNSGKPAAKQESKEEKKVSDKKPESKKADSKKDGGKKTKKKKGLGKSAKTLIIAAVSVAALVGVFLLVYYVLPQQDDPKDITTRTSSEGDSSELEVPAEYPLVVHVPSEVKQIDVENETGKYTVLAETPFVEVTMSDGTKSMASESTKYTLVGYEDMELLLGIPDALANDAAALTASKLVNDGSKKSDFGFDEPRAKVTTTFTTGDSATVILGGEAPDDQGAYVMKEGDDNIYLVSTDSVDGYLYGAMGMISTVIGSAATDDDGNVFSKMVLGGTLFGADVEFEYANDDAFSETYRIVSPDNVLANEEVVTYMLNNIRSLTATEVMAVNADPSVLKDYGLDEPYVTVSAEYPDLKVDYKASKPEGSEFYLLSNKIIYKMSTDSVPWVLHDYNDCVVKYVIRPKYGSVTGITVEADGKTYKFDVKTTTTTDSDGSSTDETTVTCNGASIDSDKFSVYYQNLVSAERTGAITEKPSGKKSLLKVTFEFSNGETSTAEYFEGANRKCPVIINGTLASESFEEYVTKTIADTPTIAANNSVESVY